MTDQKYKIKNFKIGQIKTNCYLILNSEEKKAVVIDPGYADKNLLNEIEKNKIEIESILLTHGHFDHILGVNSLNPKKTYIHKLDEEMLLDGEKNAGFSIDLTDFENLKNLKTFEDGDRIEFLDTYFKVIHTPGHTKGSSCFVFLNEFLFTGDTIFKAGVGRCDLYGGSSREMKKSVKKIAEIKENLVVLPGHGDFSDLNYEKENNQYFF